MKTLRPTLLALSLLAAYPAAQAQATNQQILDELRALRERVGQLEAQLESVKAKTPAKPQWGMTPEQAAEFNRIALKAEAMEDNFPGQGYKGLTISGMIDPTFIWTRGGNGSFAFLNGYGGSGSDFSYADDMYAYDNSYFGMAVLDIQKETEDGTQWRLTLAPGKNASSAFKVDSIVHEATVSLPLQDNQTRLILGQIPDWSGYEYTLPHEQPFVTHNLLFDFTLPSFYTGAALYWIRGNWETKVLLGNMNATRYDRDNRAPVLAYRVDYWLGEFGGWGLAGVHGSSFDARIDTLEADFYWERGNWAYQGQAGIGRLRDGAADGDAEWAGLSGLASYAITPRLKALVRADVIKNDKNGGGIFGSVPNFECELPERDDDGNLTGGTIVDGVCPDARNGFGPKMVLAADSGEWEPDPSGKGANRYALSLGLNYRYGLNTTFKVEYRLDGADGYVFQYTDGSWHKRNHLFGTSVVVSF